MKKILYLLLFTTIVSNAQVVNNPSITSSISLIPYVDKFYNTQYGLYIPNLTATNFDNPSANATNGLVNDPSGLGVVAAVSGGTTGSGSIYLKTPLDVSKPFIAAVKMQLNDVQPMTLGFYNSAGSTQTGFGFTKIESDGISGTLAGTIIASSFGQAGAAPTGTYIWIVLIGDGTNVTLNLMPDIAMTGFKFGSPSFGVAYDNNGYAISQPIGYVYPSSTVQAFGGTGSQLKNNLCRFSFTSKSTVNRIIGIYVNQNGWGNPADGQLNAPAFLKTTVLNDPTAIVCLPKKQGSSPIGAVIFNHQNANGASQNFNPGLSSNSGAAMGYLLDAGYAIIGSDGYTGGSIGTEATTSNWGAGAGMPYRTSVYDFLRNNVPGIKKVFYMGWSMGATNTAVQQQMTPGYCSGIVDVSGAYNLTANYSNSAFTTIINKAYGTFYANVVASTGVTPSQLVTTSAIGNIGDATLSVTALTNSIPANTVITLNTGTGQTQVTVTTAAAASATSLVIAPLTTAITSGAKYDMSNYWQQLNYGNTAFPSLYYSSTYTQKDTYANATAYTVGQIVTITNSTLTAKLIQYTDPMNIISSTQGVPSYHIHNSTDPTIAYSQAAAYVNAKNAMFSNSATLITTTGGTHLGASEFDLTTIWPGVINFLNGILAK